MKIAGVQMDVSLGDPDENCRRMAERFVQAREGGADLVIFPECAVTGYCFESREEARPHAQPHADAGPGRLRQRDRAGAGDLSNRPSHLIGGGFQWQRSN